jgi:hypothetical protein
VTRSEFDLFLLASAALCLVMAMLNLLRVKSRGASAYFLSGAFLAMAALLWQWRESAATGLLIALGALVFLLLIGDAFVRFRREEGTP